MSRLTYQVTLACGVRCRVTLEGEAPFTGADLEVVRERIEETLLREGRYLQAQRARRVPARTPRPCGCSGS